MEYEAVAEKLRGIPFLTPAQGRRIYDHVRSERPTNVLEIGTANGVGTSYIAAALAANGEGRVTTLDWTYATSPHFSAHPEDLPPGLSEAELREPHLQAVFDLLVRPHPAFAELRAEEAGAGRTRPPARRGGLGASSRRAR